MAEYVALLRGIMPSNPLHRSAELKRVFEEAGFERVRTVIGSGNVVFSSSMRSRTRLEEHIEAAMHEHLGKPCATIVRTRREIEELAASDVFDGEADEAGARCNVTFCKRPPGSAVQPDDVPPARIVAVRGGEVLTVVSMSSPEGVRLFDTVERTYGPGVTTRTWKTVHRLVAAFAKGDG